MLSADPLSRSSHMAEAPQLAEDKYAEFYEIDKPVINFEGEVNEIQHIQWSLIEISKERSKDEFWSKVISWVEKGQIPEKAETQGKVREVLIAHVCGLCIFMIFMHIHDLSVNKPNQSNLTPVS